MPDWTNEDDDDIFTWALKLKKKLRHQLSVHSCVMENWLSLLAVKKFQLLTYAMEK